MSTLSLLAAITIAAQPAPDHLRVARSSAEEMARFAAARVCLPVLRGEAGGLQEAVGKSGFAWKRVPGSFALVGTTPNHVQMTPRGGCYFRMDRGDGEKLRLAVPGGGLRGPDKYRVLEHRRRQAQMKARHLLDLMEEAR